MTPPASPEIGDPRLLGWSRFRGVGRLPPVALTGEERVLVAYFLRRLVRYYVRNGRRDRARDAAALWRRVSSRR